MPGSLIHHLPPLVAGQDGGEQLVLSIEETSKLSTSPFSSQIFPHSPSNTSSSSAPTQQMGQGSQPPLDLIKNCWTAVPSLTHPSGSEGPSSTQHVPWHVLTQKHLGTAGDPTPALSCPTTEAALTLAGLEGRCCSAKGTPGWSRSPCSFSQLSPAPRGLTAPRTGVRDPCLCHRTVQVCTAS